MFFTQILKKFRKAKFIHKNVETRHIEDHEGASTERSDTLYPARFFTSARADNLKRTFSNVVSVDKITHLN